MQEECAGEEQVCEMHQHWAMQYNSGIPKRRDVKWIHVYMTELETPTQSVGHHNVRMIFSPLHLGRSNQHVCSANRLTSPTSCANFDTLKSSGLVAVTSFCMLNPRD